MGNWLCEEWTIGFSAGDTDWRMTLGLLGEKRGREMEWSGMTFLFILFLRVETTRGRLVPPGGLDTLDG